MTVKEYNANLDKFLINIEKLNRPFQLAVQSSVQQIGNRIFENGQKTDGSNIGTYSSEPPIYVNPNFAARKGDIKTEGGGKLQGLLPTIGKPNISLIEDPQGERFFTEKTKHRGIVRKKGVVVFRPQAGDPHRTTYLDGGYKELRNRTGRRIDKVDLTYTGEFKSDFRKGKASVQAKGTKINVNTYTIQLDRENNIKKEEGYTKKYGTIFDPSQKETTEFERNVNLELNNELEKYGLL